jgi:DNA-binding helix-hairpin-helix protein with protein kinase domain
MVDEIKTLRAEVERLDLVRISNQQSLRNWMANYHELQARAEAFERQNKEFDKLNADLMDRAEAAERALVAGRVEAGRMWDLLECLDDQCAEGGAGAVQAIHVELHAVLAFRDAARAAGEGE